jgi:hypothetical protein
MWKKGRGKHLAGWALDRIMAHGRREKYEILFHHSNLLEMKFF